jgi:hypothetical protein
LLNGSGDLRTLRLLIFLRLRTVAMLKLSLTN